MKQLTTKEKLSVLKDLQQGKTAVKDIRPMKTELWWQDSRYPDKFINEYSGEEITAAQMAEKERTKGTDDIIFITIHTYGHETQNLAG